MIALPNAVSERVERAGIRVSGQVQGVGYRAFVHKLARTHAMTGWVGMDGADVYMEVQGSTLVPFAIALEDAAPPLARIDLVEINPLPLMPTETEFSVKDSGTGLIWNGATPDAAVCADCLKDLFNPSSRHYHYAHVSCAHCGPRYTISHHPPFVRANTTMAAFQPCRACSSEYDDPSHRRFQSQTIACPNCGPEPSHEAEDIFRVLRGGGVIALKDTGGYRFFCDARNKQAVERLRLHKRRPVRPFCVMVANLASARLIGEPSQDEEHLLSQAERPTVLIHRRDDVLASQTAPGLTRIGLSLASTPLHYMIFNQAAGQLDGTDWLSDPVPLALAVTSANQADMPMITSDSEALMMLSDIADMVITDSVGIAVRCDETIMRLDHVGPATLRRARGMTPAPIKLATPVPPVLAVGGARDVAICVTKDNEAYLSQHLGDCTEPDRLGYVEDMIEHMLDRLRVTPRIIAYDDSPDLPTARIAKRLPGMHVAVNHNHAHVAAVLAENRYEGPVVGLVLDRQPPSRTSSFGGGDLVLVHGPGMEGLAGLTMGPDQPVAGGDLFEEAAKRLGINAGGDHPQHALLRLEALSSAPTASPSGWRLTSEGLDLSPVMDQLDPSRPEESADLFHGTLISALADWAEDVATVQAVNRIVLAGGCFVNRVLRDGLSQELKHRGLTALSAQHVPSHDGGLSLGQAWVAAHMITQKGGLCGASPVPGDV